MIIFVIFGAVMAAPVSEITGSAPESFIIAASFVGMAMTITLVGICQCPRKTENRKKYSYIQKRSNLEDSEYFASFSGQKSHSIVRMDSIQVDTFPMIESHRRSY